MHWRVTIARLAVRCGINLNFLFNPVTAWQRGEPLRRREV